MPTSSRNVVWFERRLKCPEQGPNLAPRTQNYHLFLTTSFPSPLASGRWFHLCQGRGWPALLLPLTLQFLPLLPLLFLLFYWEPKKSFKYSWGESDWISEVPLKEKGKLEFLKWKLGKVLKKCLGIFIDPFYCYLSSFYSTLLSVFITGIVTVLFSTICLVERAVSQLHKD